MNKDIMIKEVKARNRENSRRIEVTKNDLGINNAHISHYQERLEQLKKEYNLRKQEVEAQLNRAIENSKECEKIIDDLIQEKELIHEDLKKAIHHGEYQCEYCKKYFSSQGIARHRTACASRTENKIINENQETIDKSKEDLIAKKKALEEELKRLEKNV